MPKESTRFSAFILTEDKELLETVHGKTIEKIAEELLHEEAVVKYARIVKRCESCEEECVLYVKKKRAKTLVVMRQYARAYCNVCKPKSPWRRVRNEQ